MPKTKISDNIDEKIIKPADDLEKIIEIDEDGVKELDDELIPGEIEEEEVEDEEVLDEEEVDPFKDKWEE